LQVLRKDLVRAYQKKRPGMDVGDIILHHDNAPSHTADTTRLDIGLLGFDLVDHPPYSPDLAPMDFRVFPVVKSALKGTRFETFEHLSNATQRVVSQLDEEWYIDMFQQWLARHEKCITCGGDYLEK
jgi:histone-lysine N-methyltransferase SETMAR